MSTLIIYSCSKDDDEVVDEEQEEIVEPTREELLVINSPWTFTSYEVMEVTSTTNENITDEDINNFTTNLLAGFTMDFSEDGTLIIDHPLSGEISRTWVIFNDDIIFDSESNTPQIWQNIEVSENNMSMETTLFSIFEDTFDSVEHYGKLHFE